MQVPITAMVTGSCEENNSYMTLSWLENIEIKKPNNITFHFLNDGTFFFVNYIQINIFLIDQLNPNTTGNYYNAYKYYS
jgi:hypothetical protein